MAAPQRDPAEPIIKDNSIRLADFSLIQQRLTEERLRRLDLVVSRAAVSYMGGYLQVHESEHTQVPGPDGVTSAAGFYRPVVTGVETLGQMLTADVGFLKKLYREDPARTDIIDAIVNGRLHGDVRGPGRDLPEFPPEFTPYPGRMMLRLFKPDEGGEGLFRAMLSPRFNVNMDNLDVATAIMEGIALAGVNPVPDTCSLTDRKLHMRFVVPELAFLAPRLLEGYHSPLDGRGGVPRAGMDRPGMRLAVEAGWGNWTVPAAIQAAARENLGYDRVEDMPVVFAGLVVSNSDVGGAARTISPQFRVQVCRNGLTLLVASDRKVHLGSEQGEGAVAYAMDTQGTELSLITLQTRDAVKGFLDRSWLQEQLDEIEALAGTEVRDPETVFRNVTKAAKFSEAEIAGVWDMFRRGGSVPTAGSLGNAITAYSQTAADPDRAADLDAAALPLMKAAAREAARA